MTCSKWMEYKGPLHSPHCNMRMRSTACLWLTKAHGKSQLCVQKPRQAALARKRSMMTDGTISSRKRYCKSMKLQS